MKITDKKDEYKIIQLIKHKQMIRHLKLNYNYRNIYPIIDSITQIQQKEKPEGYTLFSDKKMIPKFNVSIISTPTRKYKLNELSDKLVIVNDDKTHIISQKPQVQAWVTPFLNRYFIYDTYNIIPHINQYGSIDGVTLIRI